jgi:hypothetical protein
MTVQCSENPNHNHLVYEYVGLEGRWFSGHVCEPYIFSHNVSDGIDEGGEG